MRHHNRNKKFGREKNARIALSRSLVRALVLKEAIETTEAKAKALRPQVERLITKAKTDSVASRRLVVARLGGQADVTKKLFDKIGPRYEKRAGGYTRITKLPVRASDGAPMARIEFV